MRIAFCIFISLCLLLLVAINTFGQGSPYTTNGSATSSSCNCYKLTPSAPDQSGSVWNNTKINLNNPFNYVFKVNLGCSDAGGADGIAFILQPLSTSIGATGEGLGFGGISPSIGISLDTWQNTNLNDPDYDHISIQANGVVTHGNDLAGPVQASPSDPNIEDCEWHLFRIIWDPALHTLSGWFDDIPRVEAQVDLVADIFHGDPMVYWGFSGATGGNFNLQQFCTPMDPNFNTSLATNTVCDHYPVSFFNQSTSFTDIANHYWTFGDGTTSTLSSPPDHIYPGPGIYEIAYSFKAQDGCISDVVRRTIVVGAVPHTSLLVADTCGNNPVRITNQVAIGNGTITQWNWWLDGTFISNQQAPVIDNLPVGPHQLEMFVLTSYGCYSDTARADFLIKPSSIAGILVNDGCTGQPISFNTQVGGASPILQWNWNFGDGQTSSLQNPVHNYSKGGNKAVKLTTTDASGCISTITKNVFINQVFANAGKDTVVVKNISSPLHGSVTQLGTGNVTYNWSPPVGLNNSSALNPDIKIQEDQAYQLTVTSDDGCVASDSVNVKIFHGSFVFVPNGFTPNGDGLNEWLKPSMIGVAKLYYFSVYNRWGQLLFTTTEEGKGWNGRSGTAEQPAGIYIWILKAIDYVGTVLQKRGTTALIR